MLVKYFRDRSGHKRGVFYAARPKQQDLGRAASHYVAGFSMCAPEDDFDRDTGLSLAKLRAHQWQNKSSDAFEEIPQSMKGEFLRFLGRCDRYFKDAHRPHYFQLGGQKQSQSD